MSVARKVLVNNYVVFLCLYTTILPEEVLQYLILYLFSGNKFHLVDIIFEALLNISVVFIIVRNVRGSTLESAIRMGKEG